MARTHRVRRGRARCPCGLHRRRTAAVRAAAWSPPNGAVNLVRTSTLAAYHDGVEHYVTSFEFTGGAPETFGSIIPLPGEPTKVERGGDWTLQRLSAR